MHVIGTAGHVDHGKSSLVRALTGTDPDRWIEERLRGMTLDLGFAHLRFGDGVEAGIVDVPGHERFLHNMLAGAAGMELLLLVVAANEGPKPQTLEHLAILQYLNVRRTIVVLSKSDTVDAEELGFAEELVREAVTGTLAEDAPVVAVSSRTGAGLDVLRAAIHVALLELPARAPDAPAYLPVDRVFALAGHGTIVTGTLMQGRIATGERLMLQPLGREVRARTLHVFGTERAAVEGGTRVAVNLPGVETAEIARGAVLASPQFSASDSVEVDFRPLPVAVGILKRRTPVRAYLGSAELLGTLAFERAPADAAPVSARLYLRTPAVVFPGAAFVVRRLSPKTLLGGGTIAGLEGGLPLPSDDAPDVAALVRALATAGLGGGDAKSLGAAANVRADRAEEILAGLVDDGRALRLTKPVAFVDGAVASDAIEAVRSHLAAAERETPWQPGVVPRTLARELGIAEAPLVRVLAIAAEDGRLAYRAGYYATPEFQPRLTDEQREFFARSFAPQPEHPYVPLPHEELVAAMRAAKLPCLALAYETLLASGALVRVGDDVYRGEQIGEIRAALEAALRRDKQLTMAAFRDLVGTSRKFAVPLLEWFDATGVTIRSGDVRVLRIVPPRRGTAEPAKA
jgi:selenocysteine-specific elongation factor